MTIAQLMHQQQMLDMLHTLIAIILTIVMMGLTWWSYSASTTVRNLRRVNEEQDARIQRMRMAWAKQADENC